MLETSYLVMETHANSTLSKCMLLACAYQSAKENGHCRKKSCQGIGRLFGKGGLFGRPFSKQTLRNYQPCVSTPKTPEQHKECVKQQKTVYHKSCPNMSYPATLEEHPMNSNDIHRVTLAQHLLYHSKGEMLRREQSKGHRKGTRASQKNIQSL